jgi:FemAB-related protein (PEP-CTERM system-associated)
VLSQSSLSTDSTVANDEAAGLRLDSGRGLESVEVTDKIDHLLWDSFVRSHPSSSPFHLMPWQQMIYETFGHQPFHLLAKTSTGKVTGVLPLFLVRSRIFGRLLVSTPQAAYGGILADSEQTSQAIFQRAAEIAKQLNVEFLELRSFRNIISGQSLLEKDIYVTFRTALQPDPEANMLAIPRKTRAEIREGIRHGLEFRVDAIGPSEFFDVYSRSVHQLGTPVFPKQLFANGLRTFGPDCKIFSVHWQGKLVAAVWTLFHKDEIVPYFGGSIREYNRLAVNNFMYGMLIQYGCEQGYKIFDFGRSKKGTGSFDFKKRWGMTMSELPYQTLLVRRQSMPDTSPLNPKFSKAIQIWQRLPLPLTQFVGPLVSKHLI